MSNKKQSHSSGIKNGSGSISRNHDKGTKKSANPFEGYRFAFSPDSHLERDSFMLDLRYYDAFDEFNPDNTDKEYQAWKRFHFEYRAIMKLIAKAPISIERIAKETKIKKVRVIYHMQKLHEVFEEAYYWTETEQREFNSRFPAHPIDWFYGLCPDVKKVIPLWYIPNVEDYIRTLPKWFKAHGPTPINKPVN